METRFIPFSQKRKIVKKLQSGIDIPSVDILINEIDRLESIIKNYELGFSLLKDKFERKTFKTPNI